jgi:amino-acid N-acetyltransferase
VPSIALRAAQLSDAPALYEISRGFQASGALLTRDRGYFAAHIAEFVVAELNGQVVGCVGIDDLPPEGARRLVPARGSMERRPTP